MSIYSNSTYIGETRDGWYHGKGEYTYASGVKYKGNFHKGQFHGEGTLIYQNGGYYKGIWNLGKKVSGDYFFFDDLKFEEENWDYCIGKDRRFNYERNNGIKPAGQTQITNDPQGEHIIPAGTYDTGDGYFDPIRTLVYSYDGKRLLRTPQAEEVDWITRTCRYEPRSTATPLTGDEDQIIERVMELQNEGRREIAEQLMKGGVREPDRYLLKEVVAIEQSRVVTPPIKAEVEKAATPKQKTSTPKTKTPEKDNFEQVIEQNQQEQNEAHGQREDITTEETSSQIDTQDVEKKIEPAPVIAEEESLDSDESDE